MGDSGGKRVVIEEMGGNGVGFGGYGMVTGESKGGNMGTGGNGEEGVVMCALMTEQEMFFLNIAKQFSIIQSY